MKELTLPYRIIWNANGLQSAGLYPAWTVSRTNQETYETVDEEEYRSMMQLLGYDPDSLPFETENQVF